MSDFRGLSGRRLRIAKMLSAEYAKKMARPQRGAITYGGGINVQQFMRDSEAQGFHCCMTPECVVLR